MTSIADALAAPRVKIVAQLEPIAGTRFQPTGFPDLGAATYTGPNGDDLLLVESAQSMANRLEAQLWDEAAGAPREPADRLPSLNVVNSDGEYLTSSRTESHRLASGYVKQAHFGEIDGLQLLLERMNLRKGQPIDHRAVYAAVFALDPLCLLHGVFFADQKWHGQPKIARALTAFVEARGVRPAHSGGVKFDHVSNTGDVEGRAGAGKASEEGLGNVPFARTEFVAAQIEASFVIDTRQIRSYGLAGRDAELLFALGLLEIRRLLDEGLRLRTACDLDVVSVAVDRPAGFELPEEAELVAFVTERAGPPVPPLVGTFGG
jgi:CRISPR-associated protein Csb1